MNLLRRWTGRFGSMFLVVAVTGLLLFMLLGLSIVPNALPPAQAQVAAPGYAVSNFATGFFNAGGLGPIGIAMDKSGNLYVGDISNHNVYKFGPAGGVASAATQLASLGGHVPLGMAFGRDGNLYLNLVDVGEVVQLDTTNGTIIRIVASGMPGACGLATDPLSGDLFVSQACNGGSTIFRVSNFASGLGTVTPYATVPQADGLAFGPDGTLYAAARGLGGVEAISGTNSPTPSTTFIATVPGGLDGIAVSANPNTPFLYTNRNDGTITKVDRSTTPPTLTDIVTGGSRGDFATVGSDGCLYATQTDRVIKVTNANGTCLPPPLGPLSPTIPPEFVTESFFASVNQPIGVAASPAKLLVTRPGSGNPRQVVSIDPNGVVSVFATLPSFPEGTREEYIAIAPGPHDPADFLNTPVVSTLTPSGFFVTTPNEAGFASNFVYVTQGSDIIKIAPDGSLVSPVPWATIPSCGFTHTGITFDRVGTFGFHLIVVCRNGKVWLLDRFGNTVAVDDSPTKPHKITTPISFIEASGPFEGPDVAPLSFTPFGGQLLVAAENAFAGAGAPTGQIFAVSPTTSTFNTVASVRAAEAVGFIPSKQCNFGISGGTYFTAVFGNNNIFKLPKSVFAGLSGALVPSELGSAGSPGLTLLTPGTTSVTKRTFSTFFAVHQGAAFCVDSVPTHLPPGKIQREPGAINPKAHGVMTVRFLPIKGIFDPTTIIADVEHVRAGITGTEKSFAFCTPNPVPTPEGPARECKFFKDKLGIPPGVGVYRGPLFFKMEYTGPGGSCADGGG